MADPSTFQGEFSFFAGYTDSMDTSLGGEWECEQRRTHLQYVLGYRAVIVIPIPIVIPPHNSRDPALISRADTWGTSHPEGQILTHDQFAASQYHNPHSMETPTFSSTYFQMALQASTQAPAGNMLGAQSTPAPVSTLSSNTTFGSSNNPVSTVIPVTSNTAPPASATHIPTRRRFSCPMPACPRTFDRLTRAYACHNKHLDRKPHVCQGACGNATCNAAYGSIENFHRHLRVPAERKVACPRCTRSFLKQNISRHKKSCMQGRRFELRSGRWM